LEKSVLALFRLFSSKSVPKTSPWFFKAVLDTYRPIRIGFYNRRILSAAEENGGKKSAMKKKTFFL
jgi:hypothetical protein